MSEERPFVLILLTWLLRALNALFLVVCFPLHKLVSLTAPHVTKEEPDAAARVLRFVLSTLALLLLLSMLGTPPIVAWLLAPTEWLPPSLAAAAALFTVVYGFAVCEKGTKLERPWETPIGAYLRGALVEAPADLLAAVGAALTLLLLVRAPPLLHALRRGPGDDAGPLDGAPAGPNVLGAAARSLPATTSWRTVVAYNLAMSAVDLLISVPAALLLGCCVWRAKEAFGRVRAKADGTLLEEGAQRVELFFQLAAALSDLPFLLLGAIVILSGYRYNPARSPARPPARSCDAAAHTSSPHACAPRSAGGLIKELRDAPSRADWKKIFASHAVSLAADLPALLGDDGEWYIDLTALWDPTDRGRAEETLARWRRRNLPAVAYFGIRRVGEEGYARGARPERFAKREAVNAHETGPALARREWAPAEADWGIEE